MCHKCAAMMGHVWLKAEHCSIYMQGHLADAWPYLTINILLAWQVQAVVHTVNLHKRAKAQMRLIIKPIGIFRRLTNIAMLDHQHLMSCDGLKLRHVKVWPSTFGLYNTFRLLSFNMSMFDHQHLTYITHLDSWVSKCQWLTINIWILWQTQDSQLRTYGL